MAFVVIYDACVLYPAPLRDLFVRLGMVGIVRARWTEQILEECFRSILEQRPDLKAEALARTRELMREAVADCTVVGYEHLIEGLRLPDPDDRHVLAAAIRAGAQAIVTFNLKDFPATALAPYDIEALHPDEFVLDLLDLAPAAVANVVRDQADALKRPRTTISDLLDTLRDSGLIQSVVKFRGMYGDRVGSD